MDAARYTELCGFCRGYDRAKKRAAELEREQLPGREGEKARRELEGLRQDAAMIDRCAREASGGGWTAALILNACRDVPYEAMGARGVLLPTNDEARWRRAREDFFRRLHFAKRARDWGDGHVDL